MSGSFGELEEGVSHLLEVGVLVKIDSGYLRPEQPQAKKTVVKSVGVMARVLGWDSRVLPDRSHPRPEDDIPSETYRYSEVRSELCP
jgi:hypothetical protein